MLPQPGFNFGSDFQLNIEQFAHSLLTQLASFTTEEGYVGVPKMNIAQRRRLTHQYITAMLTCGFPRTAPELQRAYRWLQNSQSSNAPVNDPIEAYLILEKVEAAIRMGDQDSGYCKRAVDLIVERRSGPLKYDLSSGDRSYGRNPFAALWCTKILLNYPDRTDCREASTETLREFVDNFDTLVTGARDLSFLINLYLTRWPGAKISAPPLKKMLNKLLSECEEGLFDVVPEIRLVLPDLLKAGLSSDLVAGIEGALHWSLISTSYVLENLSGISNKSQRLSEKVQEVLQNFHKILAPAAGNLPLIFAEEYKQIMLLARSLTAFARYTTDSIAEAMIPSFLDELVHSQRQNRLRETEEAQRFQRVLKNWLTIYLPDPEILNGGRSGAKIARVRPLLRVPSDAPEGYTDSKIPLLETAIIKLGKQEDLRRERSNYASIPPDYRTMLATIPAEGYCEEVNGEVIEHIVIEDLLGFRTLQETLFVCPAPFRRYLINKLLEFLQHFYLMPVPSLEVKGLTRRFYTAPMNRSIEWIHEFKLKTAGLQPRDYDMLQNLLEIARNSEMLDQLKPSVMHGDLHARNILLSGKYAPDAELRFRLIDIDKLSRTGDFAYDIGELIVDLQEVTKAVDAETVGVEASEQITAAFSQFALQRGDALFPARLNLAKARSRLKLLELHARQGLQMIGANPVSQLQADRILKKQIEPQLGLIYDLISEAIKLLPTR